TMHAISENPAGEKGVGGRPTLEIGPFVAAIKRRDFKLAREWLEEKMAKNSGSEFLRGYFLALNGMILAAESSRELSAIKIILENGRKEVAENLMEEFRKKLSQKFIPEDEAGFMSAWMDFLQKL
ncbi:MAG: hypothetical protein ACK4GQ_06275, partial [Candidatus Hadarchaeales archaeon]